MKKKWVKKLSFPHKDGENGEKIEFSPQKWKKWGEKLNFPHKNGENGGKNWIFSTKTEKLPHLKGSWKCTVKLTIISSKSVFVKMGDEKIAEFLRQNHQQVTGFESYQDFNPNITTHLSNVVRCVNICVNCIQIRVKNSIWTGINWQSVSFYFLCAKPGRAGNERVKFQ